MLSYRWTWVPGGTYLLIVTLHDHRSNLLTCEVGLLHRVVVQTRRRHPLRTDAWVVLPEYIHCLWTLSPDDADSVTRWKAIKSSFARRIPCHELCTLAQRRREQRAIWQQCHWEHLIRNDMDYRCHFNYVHLNPVEHELVMTVEDWSFSTFHWAVTEGLHPEDWAGGPSLEIRAVERV